MYRLRGLVWVDGVCVDLLCGDLYGDEVYREVYGSVWFWVVRRIL